MKELELNIFPRKKDKRLGFIIGKPNGVGMRFMHPDVESMRRYYLQKIVVPYFIFPRNMIDPLAFSDVKLVNRLIKRGDETKLEYYKYFLKRLKMDVSEKNISKLTKIFLLLKRRVLKFKIKKRRDVVTLVSSYTNKNISSIINSYTGSYGYEPVYFDLFVLEKLNIVKKTGIFKWKRRTIDANKLKKEYCVSELAKAFSLSCDLIVDHRMTGLKLMEIYSQLK